MTFYQELQLNQAGSKKLIRESNSTKEKWYHEGVFLFKILLTVAFCFLFVTAVSMIFGNENSVVGVAILLALLAFRKVNLGYDVKQSSYVTAVRNKLLYFYSLKHHSNNLTLIHIS